MLSLKFPKYGTMSVMFSDSNVSDSLAALGRNGTMKCKGVNMFYSLGGQAVIIEPINSKGIGSCFIEMPIHNLAEVISLLQEFHDNADKAQQHDKDLQERHKS